MISSEGASLIATIYPIGILILVFESRSMIGRLLRGRNRWQQWLILESILIVVLAAALSTYECVRAVSAGQDLDGWQSVVVAISGVVLYVVVLVVFMVSLISIVNEPA